LYTEAVIYPIYKNPDNAITLTEAATALRYFLDQLDGGKTVGAALNILNNSLTLQNADHTYAVKGDQAIAFTPPKY
jgi:hypothetical protein